MSIIDGDILDPGLKFLQLKNYQFTNTNTSHSGQCLAFDQINHIILACCQNVLVFIPLNSLLSFDTWTKELLKTVDTQLPDKVVVPIGSDSVNCHLVSISSKGHGSKLSLCCYDRSQASLFIKFYDLKSLYTNKERSISYNKFNIPITGQNDVQVRMLLWHPEMSDNIFACCLTTGDFYVIYVSDSDRNVLTVLSQYTTDRHVTSFAWSPKGKQIAIGFQNSSVAHFSQFKLLINEKNLVQNVPFEEVKKVNLPEFAGYHVCNICWLSTFNFMIICMNPEKNDTRYMLVSIPSAKATGDDAIMKIVDFSCINIDSVDKSPFESNFLHLENIIFTYTNRSSGIALLGCPTPNEIGIYNKWFEITLDDDASLMLPVISNESFVSIRGLTFAPGTTKQFRFSSSIVKGGPSRHFAIAYNGLGHLTLFMSDFESEENSSFLKISSAPSTLIKPIVPSIPNQAVNSSGPIPPQNASFSFLPSQPTTASNSLSNQSSVSNLPSNLTNFSHRKSVTFSENAQVTQLKTEIPIQSNNPIAKQQPTTVSVQPVASVLDTKVDSNIDQLYLEEIKSNIDEFNKEIKANVAAQKVILSSVFIGTNEQFEKIKYEFDFITRMLENLSDQFSSINVDVNDLQTSFIELHYLCEETRSLLDRNTDPKYRNILRQRNLDPITSRKVKEIFSLRDYVDVQLRELDSKFDLEWQEWLQKKRKSSSSNYVSPHPKSRLVRSPPTAPHSNFINDEPLNGDLKNFEDVQYPSQVIYKALTNNQRLIDNLKVKIKDINLSSVKHDGNSLKDLKNNENIKILSKLFNESLSLNNSNCKKQQKQTLVIQCLAPKQKLSLKSFLENRHSVPIRVCGPCGTGDQYSNKSRFLSVLEKIKLKEQKTPITNLNDLIKPQSTLKSQPKNPVTNAALLAPFVVTKTTNQNIPKLSTNSVSPIQTSNFTKAVPISKPQPKVEPIPQPVYEDISPADSPTEDKNLNSVIFSLPNNVPKTVASSLPKLPTSTPSLSALLSSSQNEIKSIVSSTSSNASSIPTFTFSLPCSTANLTTKPPFSQPNKLTSSSPFSATASLNQKSDPKVAITSSALSSFSMPSFSTSLFGSSESQKNGIPTLTQFVSKPSFSFPSSSSISTSVPFLVSNISTTTASTTTATSSFFKSTTTVDSVKPLVTIKPESSSSTLKALLNDTSPDETLFVVSKSSTPAYSTKTESITSSLLANSGETSTPSSGFSFNTALSSLPSRSTSSTISTTNATTSLSSAPNLFTSSSFSFGQPVTTSTETKLSSFSFNKTLASASEAKPSFSFFSPQTSIPSSTIQTASFTPSQPTTSISPNTEGTKSSTFTLSQSIGSPAVSATSQSVTFSLSQPLATPVESAKSSTFSFSQTSTDEKASPFSFASPTQSSIENTLGNFSICSPSGQTKPEAPAGNAFGSFSFGGNSAVTTTASLFGSNATATPSDSIFASSVLNSSWSNNSTPSIANQSQSLFSSPANKTGSFSFQTSPPPTGAAIGFGSPSKFNNNSAFGQSPVLGNTQTFGGPPTFGSTAGFGSSPSFSSPPGGVTGFGVGGQAPFSSNFNSNETYGSFSLKEADVTSFGAFAAEANQANQFNQFNSPSFGTDASFTQRRK